MSEQKSFLQIIVQGTLILLFAGSFLILLGIFNGILGWDIFGPKVEQALYAVFWSCVALACSGIAVTAVLGIREIAESATAVAEKMTSFHRRRFSVRKILFGAGMILCVITLSIAGLSYTNAHVEQHRTAVFKRLAAEHTETLTSRILTALEQDSVKQLETSVNALQSLSFIRKISVYATCPDDPLMLRVYQSTYNNDLQFTDILAARDYEKAILGALGNDSSSLEQLNIHSDFVLYFTCFDKKHVPVGILRIEGNSRENFREYRFGS
ncbi:MAG: hypothetical protein AB7E95_04525 [Kiritimatiellales bacterium]